MPYDPQTGLPFAAGSHEWRVVPEFGGLYEVTRCGLVRRALSAEPRRGYERGRLLTQTIDRAGYPVVYLAKNGKHTSRFVHRLVAEAFLGPRPDGCDINHIDGVKANPNVANLEYITRKQNMQHAVRTGLMNNKGERHGLSRLTDDGVRTIRILHRDGISRTRIAKRLGVSRCAVDRVVNGVGWTHVE